MERVILNEKEKEIKQTVESIFKAYRMIQEAMREHLEVIQDIRDSFEFLGEVFQEIKEPLGNLQVPYDLPAFKKILEARQRITEASNEISQILKGVEDIEPVSQKAETDLLNYVSVLKAELIKEKKKNKRLMKRLQELRKTAAGKGFNFYI